MHAYVSPVMLLFLRNTGIHHLWLSNLTIDYDIGLGKPKLRSKFKVGNLSH